MNDLINSTNQPSKNTGGSNEEACIKGSQKNVSMGVATHHDRFNKNHDKPFPVKDVMESKTVKLELDAIEGNVLPVTSFELDDVAFLVKPNVSPASVLTSANGSSRTISIPKGAVLLYNGKDPDFASGSVDSKGDTTYKFDGKKVFLPGGENVKLKAVYQLGMPLIAHNAVKISKLKALGFENDKKELEFKIFHVSHGHGEVNMKFEIRPCK